MGKTMGINNLTKMNSAPPSMLTKSELDPGLEGDPLRRLRFNCRCPLYKKWTARDQSYHFETYEFTLAVWTALALCFVFPF
jgi:hypothetical protein